MKVAVRLAMTLLFLGGISAIVGANVNRDSSFFRFKWKLQRAAPLEVNLAPAKRARILHTIESPGEVEAEVEVDVSSQVVSRIVNLPVREGERVKRDELLVELDSIDLQAQVRSTEARVQRLKSAIELGDADIQKSLRDVELHRKLFKSKAIGAQEMADYETLLLKDQARMAMSRAELTESEAMLAKTKEDLSDTVIRSPVEGIVSRLVAEEGEVVVIGTMNNPGTVIMTVSDMNSIVVRARIDETDVPLVKPGQKAIIHLQYDEDLDLTGTVKRITPKGSKGQTVVAQASGASSSSNDIATFETLISIDSPPPAVRLGMTANVDIQVDERMDVLSVPSQAVLHRRPKDLPAALADRVEEESINEGHADQANRYHQVVFVEADGLAHCRLVKTGISDENRVEILAGINEGDRVVSGPYRIFDKLKEGQPITQVVDD